MASSSSGGGIIIIAAAAGGGGALLLLLILCCCCRKRDSTPKARTSKSNPMGSRKSSLHNNNNRNDDGELGVSSSPGVVNASAAAALFAGARNNRDLLGQPSSLRSLSGAPLLENTWGSGETEDDAADGVLISESALMDSGLMDSQAARTHELSGFHPNPLGPTDANGAHESAVDEDVRGFEDMDDAPEPSSYPVVLTLASAPTQPPSRTLPSAPTQPPSRPMPPPPLPEDDDALPAVPITPAKLVILGGLNESTYDSVDSRASRQPAPPPAPVPATPSPTPASSARAASSSPAGQRASSSGSEPRAKPRYENVLDGDRARSGSGSSAPTAPQDNIYTNQEVVRSFSMSVARPASVASPTEQPLYTNQEVVSNPVAFARSNSPSVPTPPPAASSPTALQHQLSPLRPASALSGAASPLPTSPAVPTSSASQSASQPPSRPVSTLGLPTAQQRQSSLRRSSEHGGSLIPDARVHAPPVEEEPLVLGAPDSWSSVECMMWLKHNGFKEFTDIFYNNGFEGWHLVNVTFDSFSSLRSLSHTRIYDLLDAVAALKAAGGWTVPRNEPKEPAPSSEPLPDGAVSTAPPIGAIGRLSSIGSAGSAGSSGISSAATSGGVGPRVGSVSRPAGATLGVGTTLGARASSMSGAALPDTAEVEAARLKYYLTLDLSREDSNKLLHDGAAADGEYLVRLSKRTPGTSPCVHG